MSDPYTWQQKVRCSVSKTRGSFEAFWIEEAVLKENASPFTRKASVKRQYSFKGLKETFYEGKCLKH